MSASPPTFIEDRYSRKDLTEVVKDAEGNAYKVPVTFKVIDAATAKYTATLHEFDFKKLIDALVERYGRKKDFETLEKPGNLDFDDATLGFAAFYTHLEHLKETYGTVAKSPPEEQARLRELCEPIVAYLCGGKHADKSKGFPGWKPELAPPPSSRPKRQVAQLKPAPARAAKPAIMGIISVDIPKKQADKYVCSGTQHYLAFVYNVKRRQLVFFDSASKDPGADDSEAYFILLYTFRKMYGEDVQVVPMTYGWVLQPGAGAPREEKPTSYNNQNVFCHTWTLWFSAMVTCFYRPADHDRTLAFLRNLSHRHALLNLAMIKRFARWLLENMLIEDATELETKAAFPEARLRRSERMRDGVRAREEALEDYLVARFPFTGLGYVFNYKNDTFVSIEKLCKHRVKVDMMLLDTLGTGVSIEAFLALILSRSMRASKTLGTVTKAGLSVAVAPSPGPSAAAGGRRRRRG